MKKRFLLVLILIIVIIGLIFYFNSDNFIYKNNVSGEFNNSDSNYSYNGWTYNPNEYPKGKYSLNEIPSVNNPPHAMKQFFEDSDFNGDGVLEGREISAMDYKLKHSQYNTNGPYDYN